MRSPHISAGLRARAAKHARKRSLGRSAVRSPARRRGRCGRNAEKERRHMSDALYISPNYRADQVDLTKLDDRIRIYEDQIRGWFLGPAKALLATPHSAFAVLHILMGYFESHAVYRAGTSSGGRSPEFFRRGFTAVFPRAAEGDPPGADLEAVSVWVAGAKYSDAGCGLFPCLVGGKRGAGGDQP